jgi:hypothetical protein
MSYDPAAFKREQKEIKIAKESNLDEPSAERAYNFMFNNIDTLADYEEEYELLDTYTKHLVSRLATAAEGSESARKRIAESDSQFIKHLENRAFAKARFSKMRELYRIADTRIQMWRTKEASSRT